jgi:RNA polymerase sigma factor (sigma-70 family)
MLLSDEPGGLAPRGQPSQPKGQAMPTQRVGHSPARLSDTLDRALDRLAPAEREIFELVAFDELSVAEAARVAKIRPTAARVRLHRARTRLKRELANTPPIATTIRELS